MTSSDRAVRRRSGASRASSGRIRLAVLAALTALVGSVFVAAPSLAIATPTTEFPAGDSFYVPPSPLPAGNPGDVLRWRRTTTGALFGLLNPAPADAYQIMYLSKNNADLPIAITGTVFVPKGKNLANIPIIGYAPTTHGIGDPCAASRELVLGQDTDLININDALTRGWAVADGDYEGLGTPGDHTYVIGRAEAHSVLDSVRAAQRLTVAKLPASGPVGLWGYSQGGGSVGWAGELAASYAPELKIKGIAGGGTPANLRTVADALNGGPGFAYLLMAAVGLNTAYPELNLPKYMTDAGRAALVDLQTKCVNDALVSYAFQNIAKYASTNPLTQPDWLARIDQNRLGRVKPIAPVFLYHGLLDEFIPYGQADQLRKDWCNKGQKVKFGTHLGDHITTFLSGSVDAQNFLSDRFAGKAAPTSC